MDLEVPEGAAGDRVDVFVTGETGLARSDVQAALRAGTVTVNGEPAKPSLRLAAGDRVAGAVADRTPGPPQAEPIPLELRYSDQRVLVVSKPPGLVTHPAGGHASGTLINALLALGVPLAQTGTMRPGIVHRLDKDTSGLLLVAKNDTAHRRLSAALKRREIRRGYIAAAWGHLDTEELTIDRPVGRSPRDRKRMAVVDQGRRAVTHIRRSERWIAADLLRAELETGRTHQIRVHLASMGHPVVGDETYGRGAERGMSGSVRGWAIELARRVPRQFLHAAVLEFRHPRTGEPMRFERPLPPDLAPAAEWASRSSRS